MFFFYLEDVVLVSGFPEHGGAGGGAEGLKWRWVQRRRAEGAERSELVREMIHEFVWMGVTEGGKDKKRAGGDRSLGGG